jgi:hypothetical protein
MHVYVAKRMYSTTPALGNSGFMRGGKRNAVMADTFLCHLFPLVSNLIELKSEKIVGSMIGLNSCSALYV